VFLIDITTKENKMTYEQAMEKYWAQNVAARAIMKDGNIGRPPEEIDKNYNAFEKQQKEKLDNILRSYGKLK